LKDAGLEVVSDSQPIEWARTFGAAKLEGETARITRLVVARIAK